MVNEVIPAFDPSQHEQLKAAAREWRLPYWDWAAKKQRGDKKIYDAALILKDKDVKVLTSTGQTTIPNPLYQFTTPEAMGKWGIEPIQYDDNPPKVRSITSDVLGATFMEALAFSTSTSKNALQPARFLPVTTPFLAIGLVACRTFQPSLQTFRTPTGTRRGMKHTLSERLFIVCSV